MDGARTRGHASALEAIDAMIRVGAPHAILLSGPAGVGKTTLALDLAAGLLCTRRTMPPRAVPRLPGCRLVAVGSHPDLHWLRPVGPGAQIGIGKPEHVPDSRPAASATSSTSSRCCRWRVAPAWRSSSRPIG